MRDARMYLFADSSGAVVIPGHQIDEVLDGPRKVAAADVSDREQMSNERAR
jgi:regulator of RNase E activity RraA